MRAHRAIVGGKVPVDIEAWLFAIVRNRCHDYFRAAKPTAPLPPELPGGAPSAFEVVEQGERLAGALDAVERLPRAQRTALVGRELEGRSYEELARRQATTVSAVKSLLHRARATLAHQASLPAFVAPARGPRGARAPGPDRDGHGRRARDRRRGHRDHRAGGHERARLAARSPGRPPAPTAAQSQAALVAAAHQPRPAAARAARSTRTRGAARRMRSTRTATRRRARASRRDAPRRRAARRVRPVALAALRGRASRGRSGGGRGGGGRPWRVGARRRLWSGISRHRRPAPRGRARRTRAPRPPPLSSLDAA